MAKIRTHKNGVTSQRVRWKSSEGPNRHTQEELDADIARLEAAPDENKAGILKAMVEEKKRKYQDEKARQEDKEARAAKEHLLSKLHVRPRLDPQGRFQSYRLVFKDGKSKNTNGPVHSISANPGIAEEELHERAKKDQQKVFNAAWNGMSVTDMEQLVLNLHSRISIKTKRPPASPEDTRVLHLVVKSSQLAAKVWRLHIYYSSRQLLLEEIDEAPATLECTIHSRNAVNVIKIALGPSLELCASNVSFTT